MSSSLSDLIELHLSDYTFWISLEVDGMRDLSKMVQSYCDDLYGFEDALFAAYNTDPVCRRLLAELLTTSNVKVMLWRDAVYKICNESPYNSQELRKMEMTHALDQILSYTAVCSYAVCERPYCFYSLPIASRCICNRPLKKP